MLFELFFYLKDYLTPLNVFRYVSFRVFASMATALLMSLFLYPKFINMLRSKQIGQVVGEDGPDSHLAKTGTPTMGGILILLAVLTSTLLWADLTNPYVGMVLIVTVGFGLVGFIDDYLILRESSSDGLSGWIRLALEFIIAAGVMWAVFTFEEFQYTTDLYLPFVSTEKFQMSLPVSSIQPHRDCRNGQCGQPDGWSRRARNRPGCTRGRNISHYGV